VGGRSGGGGARSRIGGTGGQGEGTAPQKCGAQPRRPASLGASVGKTSAASQGSVGAAVGRSLGSGVGHQSERTPDNRGDERRTAKKGGRKKPTSRHASRQDAATRATHATAVEDAPPPELGGAHHHESGRLADSNRAALPKGGSGAEGTDSSRLIGSAQRLPVAVVPSQSSDTPRGENLLFWRGVSIPYSRSTNITLSQERQYPTNPYN